MAFGSSPKPYDLESRLDTLLAKAFRTTLNGLSLKSCHLETPFGLMHYYDSAPGSEERPLIMVHGLGSSGQCFAVLSHMMTDKTRIVLPDLFHFAGFSKPYNRHMTITQHVQSLEYFLDHVSPYQPVDLLGLSLGGWLALHLAHRRPQTIVRLMLLNPAGLQYRAYGIRDNLSHLTWTKFKSLYPGILYARPYTRTPMAPLLRRVLYRTLKTPQVQSMLSSIEENDFLDKSIETIQTPTLLLWGEKDRFLSSETPKFLNKAMPHIKTVLVQNCAHILCLEAPINVYNHMMHFFLLGHPLAQDHFQATTAEAKVRKAVARIFKLHPETQLGETDDTGIDETAPLRGAP